jgi:hypothetical protein
MARNGVSDVVADSMLNHRQSSTRTTIATIYSREVRWPEQQKAMDLWCDLLSRAITEERQKKLGLVVVAEEQNAGKIVAIAIDGKLKPIETCIR